MKEMVMSDTIEIKEITKNAARAIENGNGDAFDLSFWMEALTGIIKETCFHMILEEKRNLK